MGIHRFLVVGLGACGISWVVACSSSGSAAGGNDGDSGATVAQDDAGGAALDAGSPGNKPKDAGSTDGATGMTADGGDGGVMKDRCVLPAPGNCTARWKLVRPTCTPSAGPFVEFGPTGLTITRLSGTDPVSLTLLSAPAADFTGLLVLASSEGKDPGGLGAGLGMSLDGVDLGAGPGKLSVYSQRDAMAGAGHPAGNYPQVFFRSMLGGFSSTNTSMPVAFPETFQWKRMGTKIAATVQAQSDPGIPATFADPAALTLEPTEFTKGAFVTTVQSFELMDGATDWIDDFSCNSTTN